MTRYAALPLKTQREINVARGRIASHLHYLRKATPGSAAAEDYRRWIERERAFIRRAMGV